MTVRILVLLALLAAGWYVRRRRKLDAYLPNPHPSSRRDHWKEFQD